MLVGLIKPLASHLIAVPERDDNVLENIRLIVELAKEIDIKPPRGTLPGHNPNKRQDAIAPGSNEKPINPVTSIFAIDKMALSFEGLIKKINEETAAAYTSVNSALENTNSEANTGGIKTDEWPVPTFEGS